MGEYNGWTNYETWAAALWINNDQGTQERAFEICRESEGMAEREGAIESWIRDEMIPNLGCTLAADLLGAAVSEINWREALADTFNSDAEEIAEAC